MWCSACSFEIPPGARFCASCGAAVTQASPAQAPVVAPAEVGPMAGVVFARRGPLCPTCGQRTTPMPYFSRGVNIAKLALLVPFFMPVAALIFLFLRKDRLVCAACRSMLPGEAAIPLLEAFSPAPPSLALMAASPQEAHGLLARQEAREEIARLELRGRRRRARALALGVGTAALGGVGAMAAGAGAEAPAVVFLSGGALVMGLGSAASVRRSRRDQIEAEARRQREGVLAVLALARAHQGRLTVTLVASHLGLDLREAETLLDRMVDGRRVDVEVDEQGRLTYVFPELIG